jgi:hypothetical protein
VATVKRKVVVGAHLWVYAATQPNDDLTPVLPQIFSDFSYAGVDGMELMHTALKTDDAVSQIAELSVKYQLPVIGTSFNGPMWDRAQHALVLENEEWVVMRLATVGGRTLGRSVRPLRGASAKAKKAIEQRGAQAEGLQKVIALAAKHGLVLNLHNHTHEVENELHDLKGTLERVPRAQLWPEQNWLVRGGVNLADFIRRSGKQLGFFPLRDQRKDGKWGEAMVEGGFPGDRGRVTRGRFFRRCDYRAGARKRLGADAAVARECEAEPRFVRRMMGH